MRETILAGSFASNDTSGDAYNVTRMHFHGGCFVTAGDRTLKIWRIEAEKRRVHGIDVEVGKLKRLVNCIVVDEKDEIVYCGTSSGDIINARSRTVMPFEKKKKKNICAYHSINTYLLIDLFFVIFLSA